jgi:hypothetical protein
VTKISDKERVEKKEHYHKVHAKLFAYKPGLMG